MSDSSGMNFRHKSWARRLERCCCGTLSLFPLVFVYGLTSWAVYVEVNVSFFSAPYTTTSYLSALLGLSLYLLANTSYTIAVFTTPGSPLDPRQDWRDRTLFPSSNKSPRAGNSSGAYSALPTHEPSNTTVHDSSISSVTAKTSTGKPRYCKKCHTTKPDRAHHCSTCGRCVLKMDHHCPWLATCVGLHNYKPFLLFLLYTSVFCWVCFLRSGLWVWMNIGEQGGRGEEAWGVVNAILLAVLAGIIGLVLSGFTAWHIYLAVSGRTTIESLEKTRYLTPLRRGLEVQSQGQSQRHYLGDEENGILADSRNDEGDDDQQQSLLDHLKSTHANALPSILRPEEGEVSGTGTPSRSPTPLPPPSTHNPNISPAHTSLTQSYAQLEASREAARWHAYQDELASDSLPNAFDLGWRRNLLHVMGENPWLWPLPVCNSSGDGWNWEVSRRWQEARAEVARRREAKGGGVGTGVGFEGPRGRGTRWVAGRGFVRPDEDGGMEDDGIEAERRAQVQMQMQPLDRRKADSSSTSTTFPPRTSSTRHAAAVTATSDVDSYDTSSDEDAAARARGVAPGARNMAKTMENWNDIPEGFLAPRQNGGAAARSGSRGRRKGD